MTLTIEEFITDVIRTRSTTDYPDDVIVCIFGLNGEIGELTDYIKKVMFHNHPFDYNKFVDEAGDILYYFFWLCICYGVEFENILIENVAKRLERYPDGFDFKRSINR